MLKTRENIKNLVNEVFDTTVSPWERKLCGRYKCQELIIALEAYTYEKNIYGNVDECTIPDNCIENIVAVYNEL